MHKSKRPLMGPGRFQWNAGAWFGPFIGSSAWMLVTSCFLLVNGQTILASIPTTGFALVLIGSVLLWSRSHSIYPFSALMTMLGLLAIVFPVVWRVVQSYGTQAALAAMNWPESRWITVRVFVIVPLGMIWFFILENSRMTEDTKTKPDSNAVA